MFELTINGEVYSFNFGFGFYKDINKAVISRADLNGVSTQMGVTYKLAGVFEHKPEELLEVLLFGNKYAEKPRVTREILEAYIESDECDIDALCEDLLDFFDQNNITKAAMRNLRKISNMSDEEKTQVMQMASK